MTKEEVGKRLLELALEAVDDNELSREIREKMPYASCVFLVKRTS